MFNKVYVSVMLGLYQNPWFWHWFRILWRCYFESCKMTLQCTKDSIVLLYSGQ